MLANILLVLLSLTAAQAYTALLGINSTRGRLLENWLGIGSWTNMNWLYLFGGLILFRSLVDFARQALRGRLGEYFTLSLRQRLFAHQLQMSRVNYSEKGANRFLLRFSGDLNSMQSLLTKGLLRTSGDLGLILISLVCFFWLDVRIGLLVSLVLLTVLSAVIWQNIIIARTEEERRNQKSNILAYVANYLPYVSSIQALNRERPIRERYNKKVEGLAKLSLSYWVRVAGMEAIIPLAVYACLWVVLFYLLVNEGASAALAPDTLLTIILLLLSWRPVLSRLLGVIFIWQKGIISAKKLAVLWDRATESKPAMSRKLGRVPNAPLKVKDLSVMEGGQTIFEQLNFTLDVGQLLVITAPGGGGKSLLVRLLAGVQQPCSGTISIGSYLQQQVHPKVWRRRLSFISAALPLFGRDIMEAIAYSKRKKYREATQTLWAEWQALFPCLQGLTLEQRLGDRCSNLSASQERLLLWMRAILSGKKILVVDEGLADLDRDSQEKLIAWLAVHKPDLAYLWLAKKKDSLLRQLNPRQRVMQLKGAAPVLETQAV